MSDASVLKNAHTSAYTAQREQIILPEERCYLIRRDDYPNPICIWNYHPEWEIHYIPDAYGFAYVGDYIGPFKPGHLVLTGTNLPHNWITPGAPPLPGRDLVLQFHADALIDIRNICPEFSVLHRLRPLAQRGIELLGPEARTIGEKVVALQTGSAKGDLSLFLDIVNSIEAAPNKQLLASEHFVSFYNTLSHRRQRRIDQALQIMQSAPDRPMHEVAQAVGFESSAFSRAFRRHTGMNFSDYSRTLRVWRARTLLTESTIPITDICFEAGFNNLSNFNRHFKVETGMTPRAYRNAAKIRARSMII